MKFALIDDEKAEATKGARGLCASCGSELIARCGEVKINHWAHRGNRNCDPWWENETDWHRSWKSKFPVTWQEVIHFDESGEKHIADVKTENGCVLEFQHSYLNPEERRSRNAFYPKLVWVVDGARRKTDKTQFQRILNESTTVTKETLIRRVYFPDECRLLNEWNGSNALVFFDFAEDKDLEQSNFWFLLPRTSSDYFYLYPFSRDKFVEIHSNNTFDEVVKNIIIHFRNELARCAQIQHENMLYSIQNMRLANSRRHAKRKEHL